jgi:hypothetical protein
MLDPHTQNPWLPNSLLTFFCDTMLPWFEANRPDRYNSFLEKRKVASIEEYRGIATSTEQRGDAGSDEIVLFNIYTGVHIEEYLSAGAGLFVGAQLPSPHTEVGELVEPPWRCPPGTNFKLVMENNHWSYLGTPSSWGHKASTQFPAPSPTWLRILERATEDRKLFGDVAATWRRLFGGGDAPAPSSAPRSLPSSPPGGDDDPPPSFSSPTRDFSLHLTGHFHIPLQKARCALQTYLLRHKLPSPSFETDLAAAGPPRSFISTVWFSTSTVAGTMDHKVSGTCGQRKKEAEGSAALAALHLLETLLDEDLCLRDVCAPPTPSPLDASLPIASPLDSSPPAASPLDASPPTPSPLRRTLVLLAHRGHFVVTTITRHVSHSPPRHVLSHSPVVPPGYHHLAWKEHCVFCSGYPTNVCTFRTFTCILHQCCPASHPPPPHTSVPCEHSTHFPAHTELCAPQSSLPASAPQSSLLAKRPCLTNSHDPTDSHDPITAFSILCQANCWDPQEAYLSVCPTSAGYFVAHAHIEALGQISTVSVPSQNQQIAKAGAAKEAIALFKAQRACLYPPTSTTSGALFALRCRIAAAGLHTLTMDAKLGVSSTGGRTIQLGYAPAPDWSLTLTSGSLLAVKHLPRQRDSKFFQHISATAFGDTKREAYDNAAFLLNARLCLPGYPVVVSKPKAETRSELRARYHDMKVASQLYVFGQGLVVSQPSKPHKASSVRGAGGAARPRRCQAMPHALCAHCRGGASRLGNSTLDMGPLLLILLLIWHVS